MNAGDPRASFVRCPILPGLVGHLRLRQRHIGPNGFPKHRVYTHHEVLDGLYGGIRLVNCVTLRILSDNSFA